MAEDSEPGSEDGFDREERAFAQALRGAADAEGFTPVDADQLRRTADRRRRRNWAGLRGLAAAAAVVVAIGGIGILGQSVFRGAASGSSVAAAPAAEGAAAGSRSEADSGANATAAEAAGWVSLSSPLSARAFAEGAWVSGRFYVFGGRTVGECTPVQTGARTCPDAVPLTDGASYDPGTDTWTSLPQAPLSAIGGTPLVLGSTIYVLGTDAAVDQPRFAAFDTATLRWQTLAAPAHSGLLLAAGTRIVAVGSPDEKGAASDALFDPARGTWAELPADPYGASAARWAVWQDGRVLLFTVSEAALKRGDPQPVRMASLDLDTRTWTKLGTTAQEGQRAVLVAGVVAWPDPTILGWPRDSVSTEFRWLTASLAGTGTAERLSGTGLDGVSGIVAGDRVGVGEPSGAGHLFDFTTGAWVRLTAPPEGNFAGQTVIGAPDALLVVGGDADPDHLPVAYLPLR